MTGLGEIQHPVTHWIICVGAEIECGGTGGRGSCQSGSGEQSARHDESSTGNRVWESTVQGREALLS